MQRAGAGFRLDLGGRGAKNGAAMTTGHLTIDLDAIASNWRALSRLAPGAETGAVVKADAFGLGAGPVSRALARAGARTFFVAFAEEGAAVREAAGPEAVIYVLSGHMAGDANLIAGLSLVPLLNDMAQAARHASALPGHPFGIQIDTGMSRLGFQPADWEAAAGGLLAAGPRLIVGHLACADEASHPMNARQLALFRRLTDGIGVPRSLASTGGVLLGPDYHFDITRPGIGLYGGLPFADAAPALRLSLPVVQVRTVAPGTTVGYGATWTAPRETRLATLAAGYADGLPRSLASRMQVFAAGRPCPVVGRISMDAIVADVSGLDSIPPAMDVLCPEQGIDALAEHAGTIGYELMTALGRRYRRIYTGDQS